MGLPGLNLVPIVSVPNGDKSVFGSGCENAHCGAVGQAGVVSLDDEGHKFKTCGGAPYFDGLVVASGGDVGAFGVVCDIG